MYSFPKKLKVMELEQRTKDALKNADTLFIIGTTGNTHFAGIQGDADDMTILHRLCQAMLGHVKSMIEQKEVMSPMLITIIEAQKLFPELIYDKAKDRNVN